MKKPKEAVIKAASFGFLNIFFENQSLDVNGSSRNSPQPI